MKIPFHKKYIICFLVCLGIYWVNGQNQQELTPLEKKQLTPLMEPATLYKGFFRPVISSAYTRLDKIIDDDGNRFYAGNAAGYTFTTSLSLLYGISDRLTVSLDIPYYFYSFSGNTRVESILLEQFVNNEYDRAGGGLSDISLGFYYRFIDETASIPSFRLFVNTTFPTGQKNPTEAKNNDEFKEPTGDGQFEIYNELQIRKITFPFTYEFFAFYQFESGGEKIPAFDPTDDDELPFEGGNSWGVALKGGTHLNDWLTVSTAIQYVRRKAPTFVEDDIEVISKELQVIPAILFQLKRFRLSQNMVFGIWGRNTGLNPSYSVSVAYTF